jgi:hypothetical protein
MPIRRGQAPGADSNDQSKVTFAEGEAQSATAIVEPEAVPAVDISICPRCGGKLVNPQELGWCPKCSYCRSLEKDQATAKLSIETAPARTVASRFGECGDLIARIPPWGWIAAGGVCTIVALAFIANRFLAVEESLARALISLIAIVGSIVTILCVNLWSLFMLAAADEKLGPKDVFIPFGLWVRICEKLPIMRRQFLTILWCLTAFVCAIIIVGGLEYWWELYKPKKVAKTELLSAVNALAEGAKAEGKSLTEAVEDFAKKQDLKAKAEDKLAKAAPRQTTQCVVVGYTLDTANQIDGLVVAALLNDRIRYAGIIHKGIDPKESKALLTALTPLVQPNSYIAGLSIKAIWVKPAVFCEITHEEYDENRHFVAPQFKAMLSDTR